MDLFLRGRHFKPFTTIIVISLLLICLVAPLVEARGVYALERLESSSAEQDSGNSYDGPNLVTDGMSMIASDAGKVADAAGVKLLGAGVSIIKGIAVFDRFVGRGATVTATFVTNGTTKSMAFAGKAAGSVYAAATYPVSHVHNLTHLSSIIRPTDPTPAPTITQLRAQQAAIIQKGTKDLSVVAASTGSGGACDGGMGNGGYPMKWCNAPMDSLRTVAYSGDAINRECTSYAYWYFTSVEGHSGFRVTGDARYWVQTSNYPTHATPAVGAIGVETAGAFGHVVIVQALPGQTYDGHVTPAGYALVSEMNYDWSGHFRYSYSPLTKFAAYIYR